MPGKLQEIEDLIERCKSLSHRYIETYPDGTTVEIEGVEPPARLRRGFFCSWSAIWP